VTAVVRDHLQGADTVRETSEASPQAGEREVPLGQALSRGIAATHELGLVPLFTPMLDASPGVWECSLYRDGIALSDGVGLGKGDGEAAKAGALFESLEHLLSSLSGLKIKSVELRRTRDLSEGPLSRDGAVRLLSDLPNSLMACLPYEFLNGNGTVEVPIFLSVPEYPGQEAASLREMLGDGFDYSAVGRYSSNNGWAAGISETEAVVHALNEVIERDALSLLLIEQFLTSDPEPIRIVNPASLPDELAALHARAEEVVANQVSLIDMTTDLGVPAFLSFFSPERGQPARIRGAGASLSRSYAINRSLSELVQARIHQQTADQEPEVYDHTLRYARLHACRRADFTDRLPHAVLVDYEDTTAPETPIQHEQRLLEILTDRGYEVYRYTHYAAASLAVINVYVPGLERFVLVTDGQLVIPGDRGRGRYAKTPH
jgi:ribosomal protein S12 methylthiotransferase accessory factor